MRTFESKFHEVGPVRLPPFSATRVLMMPVVLGDMRSVPADLSHYGDTLMALFEHQDHDGKIGYITIDEKTVPMGSSHRRGGLHVDGILGDGSAAWGGGWGAIGTGMLTVSSHEGCRAWRGWLDGWPGAEGECSHLVPPGEPTVFRANVCYWLDGLCVHESMPLPENTKRQFVRLSLPSSAPWYLGCTPNPLGVQPTGPILPRRDRFMDA